MSKVVLAYSGGLDTSVAIRWIKEKYDMDVIALTIDVGNERDLQAISARADQIGAVKSASRPVTSYVLLDPSFAAMYVTALSSVASFG